MKIYTINKKSSIVVESGINLFKSLLKELGWTMHAMFLSAKK